MSFSSDGTRLLTADEGGTARVWSISTGRPLAPPLRHRAAIVDAAFGPGDVQIATASGDRSVRLWDARTGEPVSPPLLHHQAPDKVAFSPDGRQIVVASHEHAAYLWDIGPVRQTIDVTLRAAELAAARRIDESGALVTLSLKDLQTRWQATRRHPD